MKQPYEALGRDLYFKTKCTCPDKKWAHNHDVGYMFKTDIRLTGYSDDNFFDNVHKEAHSGACECGREFSYRWFRDGVEFAWKAS